MNFEAQLLLNNAMHHLQLKEFDKAQTLLDKALICSPKDPEILRIMSVNLALQFKFQDALMLIDQAIALDPKNGVAYSNRGNILKELARHEEALDSMEAAIKLAPAYVEAYSNKGNILQELYRYEDALEWYDKAISLNPKYAEAYSNKGNALALLGHPHEAIQCFDQATAINPNYVDAYWHKALTQLNYGEYQNGWQNYEARWFKSIPLQFQYANKPRLENLENIAGKKVFIWSEQGLGDTLQFCRYIQPLFELGAQITFGVPAALVNVLGALKKFCKLVVINKGGKDEFDFHSPLLSLPLLFNTDLDSIPNQIPYLELNEARKHLFEKEIGNKQNLRVGLIWNGGFRVDHPELWAVNKRRNIELDQIAALKDVPDIDFYSLQKGEPAESELIARKHHIWPDLINCVYSLNDFEDTAALMGCLDLIISVDTSSAHLAGALGRPVWILNRYDSCWRWLSGKEHSPWYPTAKIFHQKQPGNWDEVIERVRRELNSLAHRKHATL
ncbi:tetratricopeptide repeat protein [Polynucleobacter sp. MWH-HuK1]|uniref:tetratricopeptide repeat-containing glycosyltransferase family protein n=1 Tax=Polynucleobacter sp. MWH-HuK1 TaxID=1743158 RepID=UPI001C0D0DCE|nr:tetratricopeptide repeat-containing glycosyltransferase family protein [Polynucleobacter sp. MWH-HuK1]MBU3564663.1 tetratricopeptide repeat protein [Polynucleobacter sp. MWH-HuK1]